MASSTSGSGRTLRGTRRTRRIGTRVRANARFAGNHFAVFERGFERDQLIGRGKDPPANGQHFAAHAARRA